MRGSTSRMSHRVAPMDEFPSIRTSALLVAENAWRLRAALPPEIAFSSMV